MDGFQDNFALGTLRIGDGALVLFVLIDAFDNQPDWQGAEALYVENLIVEDNATIMFSGSNLYYLNGSFGDNVTFISGAPIPIPEPAVLALMVAACPAMVRRRRKAPPKAAAGACASGR